MTRIALIDPATATGKAKDLLTAVQGKLGFVPNMMRGLAQSPAALKAYLDFSGALGGGVLPARVRELIALQVSEVNNCAYCLAAHTAIGGMLGAKPAELEHARHGGSDDPKVAALLALARELVVRRGELRDAELRLARQAGISDAELVEVIGAVALNVFTNYFNHVAATPIDFPEVAPLSAPTAKTCTGADCGSAS
jgi:uncharacterized peroxidase-related enzyme